MSMQIYVCVCVCVCVCVFYLLMPEVGLQLIKVRLCSYFLY